MLLVGLIGAGIIAGYAMALWWLLRGETAWTMAALVGLCGIALALRLVLTQGYPWGLAEDEPKALGCAVQSVQQGTIAAESCIHIPFLLPAVFQAPLVPLIGANRWSIHAYAIITGVLATPALFAAARAMGLGVAPSLLAGGLSAVLPWSIYYGRMILGGELFFHQALMLAGLSGLIWRKGGWRDALLGGFGLCLLLWDYWAGRSMATLPLAAAVLATGRRRAWAVAVLAIALLGWVPHLLTGPQDAQVGLTLEGAHGATVAGGFNSGFAADPLATLQQRTVMALRALTGPYAFDSIFTMRTVAWQPPLLLALAGLGLLTGVRRGLFLLAGFTVGILPGIASGSFGISAHRIMMTYQFIVLAGAAAVSVLPWRWLRNTVATAVLLGIGVWSVALFFSDRFWLFDPTLNTDAERTALAEALAQRAPQRVIFMHHLGFWSFIAGMPEDAELLSVDNWLPTDGRAVTYAFTAEGAPLRAQYERLFPGRVRSAGARSFLLELEGADRAWVQQHGWSYEVRCVGSSHAAQVPFLYSLSLGVPNFRCVPPVQHIWRTHWDGPTTSMLLDFSGQVTIASAGDVVQKEGYEQQVRFTLPADSDLTITLAMAGPDAWPRALLFESTDGGLRIPDWDRFHPPKLESAPPAAAAAAP